MEFNHVSVLLDECIDNLNIKEDGVYVDCTMGGAGKKAKDILNDIAFISAYAIDDEMNEEKVYDESNQTINVSKMIKNMKAELYESNYTFTVE